MAAPTEHLGLSLMQKPARIAQARLALGSLEAFVRGLLCNIVGGAVFVGLVCWLVFLRAEPKRA